METTLIRGFVLILALAGFGSSSFSASPSNPSANRPRANTGLPTCPLNDPNHCGMTDDTL
jgi:hypothetical protein